MSKKILSQGSNSDWDVEECKRAYYEAAEAYDNLMKEEPQFQFEVIFDKEKETTIQKIKRWISKRRPPFNTILMHLFSYVELWYWEGKLNLTMSGVDSQIEDLHELWDNEHSITIRVEEGPSGVEGLPTLSIRSPFVGKRSNESELSMETSSPEVEVFDPWDEVS